MTEEQALLYGGFAEGVAVSELFQCSFANNRSELHWHPVESAAVQPPGRSAHAAVSLSSTALFVFGGFGAEGATNDLWAYTDGEWRYLEPSGDPPEPRSGHSLVALDDNRFMLFGGVGGNGASFADLHVYDANENAWQAVKAQDGPGPRYNHRAVVVHGAMVVTGGCIDDDDGMGMGSATSERFMLPLAGL